MQTIISWTITGSWLVFAGYWYYASRAVKQTTAHETNLSRALHLGWLALGFGLVFLPVGIGPLGWRMLPDIRAVALTGAALTVIGVGFAIGARAYLGQNWSGAVTLKAGHQLIRSGPYALARHPIYTGVLVAVLGAAVAGGELRGLLAVLMVALAYLRKARIEERYLAQQFGTAYQTYQQEVKTLIPFVV